MSPQAGKVVVTSQLENDSVFELRQESEVGVRRPIVPHLERLVARPTIHVAAEDELSMLAVFLAELVSKPLHLSEALTT